MRSLSLRSQPLPTLWWGVGAFLLLTLLGLINLTHADYYSGRAHHRAQLVWTLVGFSTAVGMMVIDLSVIRRFASLAYGFGVLLLIAVLFSTPVNYSRRWLDIFGLTLQPSEPMKLIVVMALAEFFRGRRHGPGHGVRGLVAPLVIVMIPALLVLIEPDLGTALVLTGVGLSVILFEGVRLRTILMIVGLASLLFPLAWRFDVIRDYQKDRIRLWLTPKDYDWSKKNRALFEKTLQPERARWAIGSGKLSGKGPRGGSRIRLRYLPEMHTDFIIATFAEEYGFVGCFLLLILFFIYVTWGFYIAQNATDRFGVLAAVGVASAFAIQVFVNLGMVTGLLPVVGVTLPLFSYGGSSLVVTMAGFGLLVNIARSRGTL